MITEGKTVIDYANRERLQLIISGDELLDNIALKYSKNWYLPFFLFIGTWNDTGLYLVKRDEPLKESLDTWQEWEVI